jgi:hypothetical protein
MLFLIDHQSDIDGWPTHRTVVSLACDCAERALKYIPNGETILARAIATVRLWTRGEASLDEVRNAYAAASYVPSSYAASAASYASYAAYDAYAASAASVAAADAAATSTYASHAASAYAASVPAAAFYDELQAMADMIRVKLPVPYVSAEIKMGVQNDD